MRKTLITIVVLLLLTIGYFAWPFVDLYRFVGAIERDDTNDITEAVDFGALRNSLAEQIVIAYFKRSGTKLSPLAESAAVAAAGSIADPLLAKLMTPEALLDFLRNGWPKTLLSSPGPTNIVGISRSQLGTAWDTFVNSDYGFGRFEVTLPVAVEADRQFKLRFQVKNWRWRLRGIILPASVQDQFADELINSMKPSSPQTQSPPAPPATPPQAAPPPTQVPASPSATPAPAPEAQTPPPVQTPPESPSPPQPPPAPETQPEPSTPPATQPSPP